MPFFLLGVSHKTPHKTPRKTPGPLSLALTAQNAFDKDPPFYDSRLGVGYDPANYDPTGRLVALQLTKAW